VDPLTHGSEKGGPHGACSPPHGPQKYEERVLSGFTSPVGRIPGTAGRNRAVGRNRGSAAGRSRGTAADNPGGSPDAGNRRRGPAAGVRWAAGSRPAAAPTDPARIAVRRPWRLPLPFPLP